MLYLFVCNEFCSVGGEETRLNAPKHSQILAST